MAVISDVAAHEIGSRYGFDKPQRIQGFPALNSIRIARPESDEH
jgi:hypothetical protein